MEFKVAGKQNKYISDNLTEGDTCTITLLRLTLNISIEVCPSTQSDSSNLFPSSLLERLI